MFLPAAPPPRHAARRRVRRIPSGETTAPFDCVLDAVVSRPQGALVAWQVQIPAVRPVVGSNCDDAGVPQLLRANPRSHGEVAAAHVHRISARDPYRVVLSIERHGLAKGGIDELRIPGQLNCRVAIKSPGPGQTLPQAGHIRGNRRLIARHLVNVHLVDAALANCHGLRSSRIADRYRFLSFGILGGGSGVEKQAIFVPSCRNRDAEAPVVGQLAKGDLEVRFRPVGAVEPELFVRQDGWPEEKAFRDRAVGLALRVPRTTSHACEDRVVDAVVLPPAANCRVALVALDEPILGSHPERLEGERLVGRGLRHDEVLVVQQPAERPEDELLREGIGIDRPAQIDAEILDHGLGVWIDDSSAERIPRDFEVGLHQQRRQVQRVRVVHEPVLGHRVLGERACQVVVKLQ